MVARVALVLTLALGSTSAKKAMLDMATFDELVFDGTTSSFVKFFAPWCKCCNIKAHPAEPPAYAPPEHVCICPSRGATGGHCKAMAPSWQLLGSWFEDVHDTLIAEVDCTTNEALCRRFKVEAFPTLKFVQAGDMDLQDYDGDMAFEALKRFADQHIKPACTAASRVTCSATQLQDLEGYLALTPEERAVKLEELEHPLREAEEKLEKLTERMEKLEEKVEEQEDIVEGLKNESSTQIRLLKSMLRNSLETMGTARQSTTDKDEP